MADDADLAAIRAWVAQGGKITVDKEGNPVLPSGVLPSGAASDVRSGDDAPTSTTPPPSAAPAAPTSQVTPTPPATPKQTKQPKTPPAPKAPAQPKPQRTHAPWYERLSDWIGERAANAPTPGGNLALILLLLFFAFAIIPVNAGKTRLQLIWLVLTGGADLPGQGAASGPTQQATEQAIAGGVLTGVGTSLGAGLGVPQLGPILGTLSGGGPGNPGQPTAAGYIPPSQQSGAGGGGGYGGLLESPR